MSLNLLKVAGYCNFQGSISEFQSGTFTIPVGETRNLEIIYDPAKQQSGEAIKGIVEISTKGNKYEKHVIDLLGIVSRGMTLTWPIKILDLEIGKSNNINRLFLKFI